MTRRLTYHTGDHPLYGDRRLAPRRYQYGGGERRSGRERRQSFPGAGRKRRKGNAETPEVNES